MNNKKIISTRIAVFFIAALLGFFACIPVSPNQGAVYAGETGDAPNADEAGAPYESEAALDAPATGDEGTGLTNTENTDPGVTDEPDLDADAAPSYETGTETAAEDKVEAGPNPAPAEFIGIMPLAVGDNEWFRSIYGGVSPYNHDTGWFHYRSDGTPAYCRQKSLAIPDGTVGDYWINAWEPGEESKMAAIFANVNSIAASYGITGDYVRALIQMCIWTISHDYESYNPSIGSVTSSDPAMLAALHALHNAAQAGYSQQAARINGLSNGQTLPGAAYGTNHVRYGPFSVSGASSASASFSGAPSGSFLGDASGNPINTGNIASGQTFYFYIPYGVGWMTVPSITIRASYGVVSVTKYSGFYGYQDQIVGSGYRNVDISASGNLYGFGKASVWKHDDEDGQAALSGAVFTIDRWSRSTSSWQASGVSINWNAGSRRYETGTLIETADNEGRFRIKETAAPYSYLSGWSEEINVHRQYGTVFAIHAANTPVKLTINLYKNDRDTNVGVPQGDAKLSGAVYGLYMNEDREHPNGTKYLKDQKIAETATDEDGMIVFDDLFPARYYIKELSPSEGYLLDDTVYEVDGVHDGIIPAIVRDAIVTEQVKKQAFELIKIGTSEAETEVSLLGAGFKVYLISELSGVKDGSLLLQSGEWSYKDFKGYDFSNEQTAMIDGVNTPEFFTDSLGHLISPEFPYGVYIVIESTTPKGYMTVNPFIVTITEDSRQPQPWRIFDDKEIKFYIRIIKKDSETSNTILGKSAAYRIFDLDKNEYVRMKTTYPNTVWYGTAENPFVTDETGTLITPEKLVYGHYRIDEVSAPTGYVLAGHEQLAEEGYNPEGKTTYKPSEPVYIEFDDITPVYIPEADADVLEFIQYNEQQKGRIYIEKHGEVPGGKKPLEGVEFRIIANGDIVSQDGSGALLYKNGETVQTLVTDEDGHAWSDDLYIGNYILREAAAPSGYILLPDKPFSITAIGQTEQYTFLAWSLTNKRPVATNSLTPYTPAPVPVKGSVPKTGDDFNMKLFMIIMLSAIVAMLTLAGKYRKYRKKG